MSDSGVKIEVHLIQNFAPSNLNRDDTGQPKSAYFGGYRRARVSSQCSKRSIRQMWQDTGVRTKLLKSELLPLLALEGRNEEQVSQALNTFITQFYSKMDGEKTAVLLFVSREEITVVARLVNQHWDSLVAGNELKGADKNTCATALEQAKRSADIALFGRMLAEQPGRNSDGACQVAHPISTHKVDMEMDFYTAVDDLAPEDETGAGMMGVVGFNSACYYRYAVVDRDLLARNLCGKTRRANGGYVDTLGEEDYQAADQAIEAFLNAMVYAIPTGKQHSFAAQNLPAFGLFVWRAGGVPVSLANAFAKPVRPSNRDDDLVGLSVEALVKHWAEVNRVYGTLGTVSTACFHLGQAERLNGLGDANKGSVAAAIDAVMKGV